MWERFRVTAVSVQRYDKVRSESDVSGQLCCSSLPQDLLATGWLETAALKRVLPACVWQRALVT